MNKAYVFFLPFLLSCSSIGQANRNTVWTSVLNSVAFAYQQAGRKCIADSSTRDDAVKCLSKVRDDFDPVFAAIEATSDLDNAVVALCAKAKFNGVKLPDEIKAMCAP